MEMCLHGHVHKLDKETTNQPGSADAWSIQRKKYSTQNNLFLLIPKKGVLRENSPGTAKSRCCTTSLPICWVRLPIRGFQWDVYPEGPTMMVLLTSPLPHIGGFVWALRNNYQGEMLQAIFV